jgi:hypothetical protein
MKLKAVVAVVLSTSIPSFAFSGPSPQLSALQSSKMQDIQFLLETRVGRRLSKSEKMDLAQQIGTEETEARVIHVRDSEKMTTSVALYCVAVVASAGLTESRAVCASLQTMRTYELATLGAGYVLELQARVMRLVISYDGTRYDENFDPIPGTYVLGSVGYSLVLGWSYFEGDSGNKHIEAFSRNIGTGVNLGTVAALVIR